MCRYLARSRFLYEGILTNDCGALKREMPLHVKRCKQLANYMWKQILTQIMLNVKILFAIICSNQF